MHVTCNRKSTSSIDPIKITAIPEVPRSASSSERFFHKTPLHINRDKKRTIPRDRQARRPFIFVSGLLLSFSPLSIPSPSRLAFLLDLARCLSIVFSHRFTDPPRNITGLKE